MQGKGIFPYDGYETDRKLVTMVELILSGEAKSTKKLADYFGVTDRTIRNYRNRLMEVWNVDIEFDSEGVNSIKNLGALANYVKSNYLRADDVNIILATLVQSKSFMPERMTVIQKSLVNLLEEKEAARLNEILTMDTSGYSVNDRDILHFVRKIREALIDEKKIEITYKPPKKLAKRHKITPYSFACDFGKYYLISKTEDKDFLINFRIDRIESIVILKEEGKRPAEFNVNDYLKKTWYMYSDKEVEVRVRFDDICYEVVTEKNMVDGKLINRVEGEYFEYKFRANGTKGIIIWLLGFGGAAEVLSPESLREEIKRTVSNMVKKYCITEK
jgi:predicted DNA-binding transcriptional regulator YafY